MAESLTQHGTAFLEGLLLTVGNDRNLNFFYGRIEVCLQGCI